MQLKLNILDDFKCLAGDCPITCCQTWNIEVDTATLASWQTLPDNDLQERLATCTTQCKIDGQSQTVIKQGADARCVLLEMNDTCSLQATVGHTFLPEICQTYPRRQRNESLRTIQTASMTCPVITESLLRVENPALIFQKKGEPKPVFSALDFDLEIANKLDELTNQALTETRFPLRIRILFLAKLLITLAASSQQATLNETALKRIFNKPKQQLYDLNQLVKNKRLKPTPTQAGQFWYLVYFLSKTDNGQSLLGELGQDDFIRQADTLANGEDEAFKSFYQQIVGLREAARPELLELDKFGSNYLITKFINNGFPMQPIWGNFLATFLQCIYPYALINLYLWLLFAKKKSISEHDIVMAITKVERHLDHGLRIYTLLETHPQFLRLDLYADCLVDL